MDYKALFDLKGKVCFVTGAIGYLGSECAKALKDFGATVVAADIRGKEDRWEGFETPEESFDHYIRCDVSDLASVRAAFKETYEKFGRIDVLVNVAFAHKNNIKPYGNQSWFENMPDDVFEFNMSGVVVAPFRCMREVIPYMKKNGGSIINFCSMYGLVAPDLRIYGDNPQRQRASYGVGKAAVDQLTRYAASDFGRYKIRVNSVTPGPFPNPKNQSDAAFNQKLADKTMLGRFGQSYEMAGAVLFLASDASSFMTGTNVVVDGGWTAW